MAHLPYIQKFPPRKSNYNDLPAAVGCLALLGAAVYVLANYFFCLFTGKPL